MPRQQFSLLSALKVNNKLSDGLSNAFDWLFMHETLVKSGRTPFIEIFSQSPMTLRFYPRPGTKELEVTGIGSMPVQRKSRRVPIILVPPLGVATDTFDLMPQRSLARFMSAAGFHTYLVDWGEPGKADAHLGLTDYADKMLGQVIAEVKAHSGSEEVSLMGWCMGGLLVLLQAGFSADPNIKNIVLVASPINLRSSGLVARSAAALNVPAKLIRKYSNLRLHALDPARLAAPDWLTTLSFKLTDPIGSVSTYWDLLTRLWDREFVEAHSTTSDYLNNMLLYPGGVLQDMVVNAAVDNQFAKGKIVIRGKVADLTQIQSNMMVYAGAKDALVSPGAARKIIDVVSSKDAQFNVVPGGHMGVILGSGAVTNVWQPVAEWLSTRSGEVVGEIASGAERDIQRAERQRLLDEL